MTKAPATENPRRKWRIHPHLQGLVLLVLAVALLWAGQQFDPAVQQAHHRLLVSTPKARGDIFEKSVILVMQHMKSGAAGIVLNKDTDGKHTGGPVGHDKIFTLHTPDAVIPETAVLKDIRMGLVTGASATQKLLALQPPPDWHVTVAGYAGWSGRQLDYEIKQGEWRIIPFDKDLVRLKGQAMWEAADARAAARQ